MSPDIADATVVLCEVALRSGIPVYIGDHIREKEANAGPIEAHEVYDSVGGEFEELDEWIFTRGSRN